MKEVSSVHPGNPGPATLYHDTKNDLAGAAPPARPDYCCTREESKIGHQPPIRLIPAPHIAGVHSSRRGKPDRYSLWHLRTFCSSAYRVLYRPPPHVDHDIDRSHAVRGIRIEGDARQLRIIPDTTTATGVLPLPVMVDNRVDSRFLFRIARLVGIDRRFGIRIVKVVVNGDDQVVVNA